MNIETSTEFVPQIYLWIINTILETLTSFGVKRFATALPKLFVRHVWHVRDVIMMSAGFTRAGIFLNIILLLILVNPLLAVRVQSSKREKIRQQQAQEERQTEFVKGKSKLEKSYVETHTRIHPSHSPACSLIRTY